MMKVSIEANSLQELLENISLLCGEIERLDEEPEADPKPVLQQYDLTWGQMWALADRYEASGRLFTALLVSHSGHDTLRNVPIGSWAAIAEEANEKLKRDAVVKDLR